MSVLSWLKSAALAATLVAAGSLLAPMPVNAQEVTVLRGSPSRLPPPQPFPSQPYAADQSSDYSPSTYDDDYPYYGDGFPVGDGFGRRFPHRGGFRGGTFHRGFRTGFHGGGFHGGFRGGFHGAGFHGGGFHGGGFHGGGGHR
jgi:hypothetical protein